MTMYGDIEVRRVETARDRNNFLKFPWRIYRKDPIWVPPLIAEMKKRIDPQQGAFFKRGEAELFIAWRGLEPVGTICAAEDSVTNQQQGKKDCVFGFFEYVQDLAVFEALLIHIHEWARARGLDALFGPFNLDYEDGYGVLIEGRDCPAVLSCGHSPEYYREFMEMERFGFQKARGDNLAFRLRVNEDTPAFQQLSRLAARVRKRRGFSVRSARIDRWEEEADNVFRIINASLDHLEGRIPWQRDALVSTLEQFRKIADPELILFAEDDSEVVGFFPALPNLNEALIHANGLRYPWDTGRLWWQMRRQPEWLTIKSVLVLPEYWGSGLSLLLFAEMLERARVRGFKWVDLSLTAEDNPKTPQLALRFGGEVYKRYRTYRRRVV
jgi:GNAT superfamily N-acetyltransferase